MTPKALQRLTGATPNESKKEYDVETLHLARTYEGKRRDDSIAADIRHHRRDRRTRITGVQPYKPRQSADVTR